MWNGSKRLQIGVADVAQDTITIRSLDWDRDRVRGQVARLLRVLPALCRRRCRLANPALRGVLRGTLSRGWRSSVRSVGPRHNRHVIDSMQSVCSACSASNLRRTTHNACVCGQLFFAAV